MMTPSAIASRSAHTRRTGATSLTPTPTVTNTQNGVYRASFGSGNGVSGAVSVLTLRLVGVQAGATAWLQLVALDVSDLGGGDLTPQTTSTRFPIVLK